MRTDFDVAPYYRSSVGFDRIFDLFDAVSDHDGTAHFPPYDIVKVADHRWRIALAVPGFAQTELDVVQKDDELRVTGKKQGTEPPVEYLHRGIETGAFDRRFALADYVRVVSARLADGMLSIELERELPEEKKPRSIHIESQASQRA